MVPSALFYQVKHKLNEIFGYSGDLSFEELPLVVCDDLYQLPTVRKLPVYSNVTSISILIAVDLWHSFKMVELTQVMRHIQFINVLNGILEGEINDDVQLALISRFFKDESSFQRMYRIYLTKINQSNNILKCNCTKVVQQWFKSRQLIKFQNILI